MLPRPFNTFPQLILMLFVGAVLVGCSDDAPQQSWGGYAWNIKAERAEWWFSSWESRRDCVEAMRYAVNHAPQNAWYSEPVGCGYSGNTYALVWLMNTLWGGKHIQCIVRSSDPEARKSHSLYSPLLDGYPRHGKNYYCM